jgi:hypothetical protein
MCRLDQTCLVNIVMYIFDAKFWLGIEPEAGTIKVFSVHAVS